MISRHFLALFALLVALTAFSWPAEPLKDRSGDPLPEGAVARLGSTRLFHPNVHFLAFSPDSKKLASVGSDGTVRVWDTATGKQLWHVKTPKFGSIYTSWKSLFFSPDGTMLSLGCTREYEGSNAVGFTVRIWQAGSGKELLRVDSKGIAHSLAFSPDSQFLARHNARTVEVYDLKKKATVRTFSLQDGVHCSVAFTEDGKTVVATTDTLEKKGRNFYAIVTCESWDIATGKSIRRHRIMKNASYTSFVSHDGKYVAAPTRNGQGIVLWHAETGKQARIVKGQLLSGARIAFSADGRFMSATSKDGVLQVWDIETGQLTSRIKGHHSEIRCVALSQHGKLLASTTRSDNAIHLWDLKTEKERFAFGGHRAGALVVRFNDSGRSILTGSQERYLWSGSLYESAPRNKLDFADWSLREWDATSGEERRSFSFKHQEQIRWTVFSRNGRLMATVTLSGVMRLWDVDRHQLLRQWTFPTREWPPDSPSGEQKVQLLDCNDLSFSPDDKKLISAHKSDIRVWDVATGKEIQRWKQATEPFRCLISSNDDVLVSAVRGDDWLDMYLLDGMTGKKKQDFGKTGGEKETTFSPDGRTIVSSPRGEFVRLFEVASGKERLRFRQGFRDKKGYLESVFNMAFSPDGRLLAVALGDKQFPIRICRATTGETLADLKGHNSTATSLDWSPDGTRLVSAGYNENTALVWDVSKFSKREQVQISANELDQLWDKLADGDAALAYRSIHKVVEAGEQSTKFLGEQLKPVPMIEEERLKGLFDDLGSDNFAKREAATKELEQLRDAIERPLRERLQNKPPLEVQRRLERLLKRMEQGSPETLQAIRAVEALEGIGSTEAQKVLKRLAGGQPSARLTWEANKSLERLEKRQDSSK